MSDLLAGSAYPLATNVGPGWGDLYDPSIKPDTYDINAAAAELRVAGYSPTVGPEPAPIAFTGSPMLGSGSVVISGLARASHEMLVIQQSTDGGKTWKNYAAADLWKRQSIPSLCSCTTSFWHRLVPRQLHGLRTAKQSSNETNNSRSRESIHKH